MEDWWSRSYSCKCAYEPCSSSYSQAAACLPHIDTNVGIHMQTQTQSMNFLEPGTCIDVDAPAVVILDALSTEKPHDSGLLGTASLGPVVQLDQTPEDDSSQALTQYWPKFVANFGDPTQILTCNSAANSFLDSSNPSLPPTRIHRKKKAAGGGGGDDDHEASRVRVGNVQKLVERQRRNKMKALCSTLISLLPEEYRKTKYTLLDKLLEAIKYISHLQDKVIEVGKKRDELKFMATVKPFSTSSCVYKNLQASQARAPIEPEKHQTVRVGKFGPGIQVTVNTFKNQIELSILLMVLQEAGLEVVDATVSAINDRVFYSIQSKLSDFRQFDSAVLHGRIDHLMNGNLP